MNEVFFFWLQLFCQNGHINTLEGITQLLRADGYSFCRFVPNAKGIEFTRKGGGVQEYLAGLLRPKGDVMPFIIRRLKAPFIAGTAAKKCR